MQGSTATSAFHQVLIIEALRHAMATFTVEKENIVAAILDFVFQ